MKTETLAEICELTDARRALHRCAFTAVLARLDDELRSEAEARLQAVLAELEDGPCRTNRPEVARTLAARLLAFSRRRAPLHVDHVSHVLVRWAED